MARLLLAVLLSLLCVGWAEAVTMYWIDGAGKSVPFDMPIAGDVTDEPRQLDQTTCTIMMMWQDKIHEKEIAEGPPYREYKSYAGYHIDLLREMCLAYYTMQQPKNHGILLSHGAPNF